MLYTSVNLDWRDTAFVNASVVRAYDPQPTPAPAGEYSPVFVRGSYGCPIFSGWPGVGTSPADFSMKAYVDDKGIIYHRDTRAGRVFICRGKRATHQ